VLMACCSQHDYYFRHCPTSCIFPHTLFQKQDMCPSSVVKVPIEMGSSESKPPFGVKIREPTEYKLLNLLVVDPVSETLSLDNPPKNCQCSQKYIYFLFFYYVFIVDVKSTRK